MMKTNLELKEKRIVDLAEEIAELITCPYPECDGENRENRIWSLKSERENLINQINESISSL